MKDNEYYRPAESGTGTEEPSAVRDEFARPKAASARPARRRRQHGRLLQLLCGAAAVTVIVQAALPACTAAPAFAAPLRWEEVTLLNKPVKDVRIEDLTAAYGPGNVRSNEKSYIQETDRGYGIELQLSAVRRSYSKDGPNAGERYYTQDRRLTSTNPNLALNIRGIVIGMDVRGAMERVGFSENVWNLLTALAPEYEKPDSELMQAFKTKQKELLDAYGIDELRAPYYLGGYEYSLPYDTAGQSASDHDHDNTWQIKGRDPYHGEWIVQILYDYHNEFDCNGDHVRSVEAAGFDCNGLRFTFEDGVLTEIYVYAVGAPEEQAQTFRPEPADTPEPAPVDSSAPEPEEAVPSEIVLPDILRWEEITIAGIPFDRLTPEDVAACYPGGWISTRTAFENGTSYFYEKRDAGITFVLSDFSDGSHGRSLVRVMYFDLTQPYPDPEFRGLKIGMTVDEVLSRIGIPEEKWELLGIDKQQGYAMSSKEVFDGDNTEKPYCHVRINFAWENERELVDIGIFYGIDQENPASSTVNFIFRDGALTDYYAYGKQA